jgi:hypothetical protein
MHGEIAYSYILVGKLERKGQIGILGIIGTGLTGVWYEGVDSIKLDYGGIQCQAVVKETCASRASLIASFL